MSIRLLVLVGPTASGKTRLGVEIAHALGSEILSADSRQTYRGLDLGSGKDLDEYRAVQPPVPYHLIDVADPRSAYSVYHYQRDCYHLLDSKRHERPFSVGVPLLMVGGTGLYVEAVLGGYRIANVPEDVELRRDLLTRDREELLEMLRELEPGRLEQTDTSSLKRIARSVEIALYSRRQEVQHTEPPDFRIDHSVFVIDIPREELHRRIDLRLETRLGEGMIAEVERLLSAGVSPDRMAQLGLEYGEVTAFLQGRKTEAQMLDDLRRGIRKLAKRQLTWFRGFPRRGIDVTWIHPDDRDAVLEHPWIAGR